MRPAAAKKGGLRRSPARIGLLCAAAAMVVAAGPSPLAAHGDSSVGEPGDPKRPARTVEIVMSEGSDGMRFTPDRVEARRGEQVRFTIHNAGAVAHEFFLGTPAANKAHAAMMAAMPDMKHSDANAVTVAPGASATLVWRFTHKGEFEFACLVPGHYELGMHGMVAVQ